MTSQPHIALVTDTNNLSLSPSDAMLLEPLKQRDIRISIVPWETPDTDWRTFDLVILRSCWNYYHHLAAFRSWIDRLEAERVRLYNPASVVRWNLDKRYLRELAEDGMNIVPTVWADSSETRTLAEIIAQQGWQQVVVKPRISASAHGIFQSNPDDAPKQQAKFVQMLQTTGVLIQPQMPQIAQGEWSFIFLNGRYSHTARKLPGNGTIFVQKGYGGVVEPGEADPHLLAQGSAALQAALARLQLASDQLLYARIDGLDVDGMLLLMEVELIEPGLFFDVVPGSAERFADAIVAQLEL